MEKLLHRLLGALLLKGGKLYLRRRYGSLTPSRRTVVLALLGLVGTGAAVAALRSRGEPPVV